MARFILKTSRPGTTKFVQCIEANTLAEAQAFVAALQSLSGATLEWEEESTVSTPMRALNTSFQPNTNRRCYVSYVIQIDNTVALLGGGQTGTVKLLTDANSPPTTQADVIGNDLAQTLGLTVGLSTALTVKLSTVVMRGHYVKLETSGNAAFTILVQREVPL